MPTSPRLGLQLMAAGQQGDITFNEAVVLLEALNNVHFLQVGLDTPPGGPSDGDTYFTGTSPTGLWVGQASKIAIYYSSWRFFSPTNGVQAFDAEDDEWIGYATDADGSEWHPLQTRWSTTEYWTGRWARPYNTPAGTKKRVYARVVTFASLVNAVNFVVDGTLTVDYTYPHWSKMGSVSVSSASTSQHIPGAGINVLGLTQTWLAANAGGGTLFGLDYTGAALAQPCEVLYEYCKAGA